MSKFEKELTELLNKHSMENVCDVPDFLLSKMICRIITSIGGPIKETLDWHGCDSICHPKDKQDNTDIMVELRDQDKRLEKLEKDKGGED